MTKRSFKQQLEHQNILVQTYNLKGVSEHGDDLIIVGVVYTCKVLIRTVFAVARLVFET